MTLHQPELTSQQIAHKAVRDRLLGKPAIINYRPVLRLPTPEPKPISQPREPVKKREPALTFKPLWMITDVSFDWHVQVWREMINSKISDIAHENVALRAALRVAGIDLELAYDQRRPTKEIIAEVLESFPGITWAEVKGKHRTRDVVLPRQLCMYEIYCQRKDMSFPRIGRLFGNRDHTTVLHAVRKIQSMTAEDMYAARRQQKKHQKAPRRGRLNCSYAQSRVSEIRNAAEIDAE